MRRSAVEEAAEKRRAEEIARLESEQTKDQRKSRGRIRQYADVETGRLSEVRGPGGESYEYLQRQEDDRGTSGGYIPSWQQWLNSTACGEDRPDPGAFTLEGFDPEWGHLPIARRWERATEQQGELNRPAPIIGDKVKANPPVLIAEAGQAARGKAWTAAQGDRASLPLLGESHPGSRAHV